jgi:hypothetical protein
MGIKPLQITTTVLKESFCHSFIFEKYAQHMVANKRAVFDF